MILADPYQPRVFLKVLTADGRRPGSFGKVNTVCTNRQSLQLVGQTFERP